MGEPGRRPEGEHAAIVAAADQVVAFWNGASAGTEIALLRPGTTVKKAFSSPAASVTCSKLSKISKIFLSLK